MLPIQRTEARLVEGQALLLRLGNLADIRVLRIRFTNTLILARALSRRVQSIVGLLGTRVTNSVAITFRLFLPITSNALLLAASAP